MTIQEMEERENIYPIIEETLKRFYKEVYDKEIEIKVERKHAFQRLLVYPRIGFIIPIFPSWNVMREMFDYFNVRGSLVKKVIAWSYILLCICTFGLFAKYSIRMSDYSMIHKNVLIIPNNRKIRIHDYSKKQGFAILKTNFDSACFKTEVDIRRNQKFEFILPVERVGRDYYSEQLLIGCGLVRMPPKKQEKYRKRAIDGLFDIYRASVMTYEVSSYITGCCDDARNLIKDIVKTKPIDKKQVDLVENIIVYVESHCKDYKGSIIHTCITHGDLQGANIHIDKDNDKVYVIDWETAKRRSVFYDLITIYKNTRREGFLAELISDHQIQVVKDEIENREASWSTDERIIILAYMIEDLAFYLEEISHLPGITGCEVIERYTREIEYSKVLEKE